MALSSCPAPRVIADSCLERWEVIGSGGFGQIYKARHHRLCCDVAIKLLHYDDGNSKSLLREIDMMRQGSSPHVVQVLGVFKGRTPSSGSVQLGLVMEVMERGSLASLQKTLRETPPWPLVIRMAHQVALGTNFLHCQTPPLLHLDLKPSNVLLDSDLNAKLTDFGLSRFYQSVTRLSKKDSEEEGGTINYMPPEAFNISYSPTKASDIYSYGILLWSIVTGKQPYANAMSSIVRIRIPEGDRPSLDEIRDQAAGRAGLEVLMELMKKCWDPRPKERPTSHECTTMTEELFKMHKHAIFDAVRDVQKKLDQREQEELIEQVQRVNITQASVSGRAEGANGFDNMLTGPPPIQEWGGSGWTPDQRDRARGRDLPSPGLPKVCNDDLDQSSTEHKVKVSSVCPIESSPPSASIGRSTQSKTAKNSQKTFLQNVSPQYHRQFSSPDTFPCHLPPAPRGVNIHLNNVVGFQHGNHNIMHIYTTDLERKRHPTAPSRVDLPPLQSGNRRDKTGGVG